MPLKNNKKKSNKIIIFMPFIGGGGVEKNLFIISNYLSLKFGKIFLITSSKKFKTKFNKKVKFITPKKKISEGLNLRFKYLLCLYLLLKFMIKNKNSLVLSFQANIYCILVCKLFNVKIITRSNSSPSGWHHNFIKKFIYKKIVSFANLVIVNSIEFKKEMKREFDINSTCIYNPLNKKEILEKSKKKIKINFFKQKNSLKIINVGRLVEQKNHTILLQSINYLKKYNLNLKVLIIGRGVEKEKLVKFIKDNNLKKVVKIINFQNNPYPYINKSDLFILTSKYEGLPNVLLEAAVLKKFIISSDCPTGPKEILLNGKGGFLFKEGNYKDLSNKILNFAKNKKNLKSKINYNYKNLIRFDFYKNLNKYYNAINKLL